LFWLYKSATPGKMVLNIKVVDVDTGEKLSVGQSIGRYFAYIPAMARISFPAPNFKSL
jgi:uncharacterized RDD family membrane protein YckC